jgi:hypothetical protein
MNDVCILALEECYDSASLETRLWTHSRRYLEQARGNKRRAGARECAHAFGDACAAEKERERGPDVCADESIRARKIRAVEDSDFPTTKISMILDSREEIKHEWHDDIFESISGYCLCFGALIINDGDCKSDHTRA